MAKRIAHGFFRVELSPNSQLVGMSTERQEQI